MPLPPDGRRKGEVGRLAVDRSRTVRRRRGRTELHKLRDSVGLTIEDVFDHLRAAALPPDQSVELIEELAAGLR
ncbi:MAG TPA: hypothetical protein VK306_04130 [Acidimicrobiales bacterium]|nr:hypothetical protein [Acidimicrobiales bacterium]